MGRRVAKVQPTARTLFLTRLRCVGGRQVEPGKLLGELRGPFLCSLGLIFLLRITVGGIRIVKGRT